VRLRPDCSPPAWFHGFARFSPCRRIDDGHSIPPWLWSRRHRPRRVLSIHPWPAAHGRRTGMPRPWWPCRTPSAAYPVVRNGSARGRTVPHRPRRGRYRPAGDLPLNALSTVSRLVRLSDTPVCATFSVAPAAAVVSTL